MNQIRDTRERIEIKHLKFSDIAQREFDKIMPNDLTQHYSRSVPRSKKPLPHMDDDLFGDSVLSEREHDDQLSSMEQIRQSLDDADNVLGVVYRNKPLKKKANSFDGKDSRLEMERNEQDNEFDDPLEEGPSVEWLPSSASEKDKCDIDD